jgi:hypothetical protein
MISDSEATEIALERFRRNAFRFLGVSADASQNVIKKVIDRVRRLHKLGLADTRKSEWDAAWLGAFTRTEEVIDYADARLGQSQTRIEERLFWFADNAFAAAQPVDPPSKQRSNPNVFHEHDRAARALLDLLQADRQLAHEHAWLRMFLQWEVVVKSDAYWDKLLEIETRGGFAAPATAADVEQLREWILPQLCSIVVSLCGNDFTPEHRALVQRGLKLLSSARLAEKLLETSQRSILEALAANFENFCREVRLQCSSSLQYSDRQSEANRVACQDATTRVEMELVPALNGIIELCTNETRVVRRRVRAAAATCLDQLALDCDFSGDLAHAELLLQRARELAADLSIAPRIREHLTQSHELYVNETLAEIPIDGRDLIVSRKEIQFGRDNMPVDQITGLRFSVGRTAINAARPSDAYTLWLTDGARVMAVNCASSSLLRPTIAHKKYREAVRAIQAVVQPALLEKMVAQLKNGNLTVGDLVFDTDGIHHRRHWGRVRKMIAATPALFTNRHSEEIEQEYLHLPWHELGRFVSENGYLKIFRKDEKRSWAQVDLTTIWNAVCLPALLDQAKEFRGISSNWEEQQTSNTLSSEAASARPPTAVAGASDPSLSRAPV